MLPASRPVRPEPRRPAKRGWRHWLRWTILGVEWLADSDELTPTMKLKRRNIATKYAAEIAAMYD